jgi:hypothetical protein
MQLPMHSAASATAETQNAAFIVGAPRCGTTSLARYLKRHPQVSFSIIKEPHFFAFTDLRGLDDEQLKDTVAGDYLDRFFPDRAGFPLIAEGSVTSLYIPDRVVPVLKLWPDAKFIISVRNPLEMIPSLHQRLFYNGDEDAADFAKAWALVPERRQGRRIPKRCADPRWLDYWESGMLGRNVAAFVNTLGRERCFISVFDDYVADPAAQYRRMLDFLGLPADGRTDFSQHRESRGVKSATLQRLLQRPPKAAVSLFGRDAQKLRVDAKKGEVGGAAKAVLGLRKRLLNWNKTEAPRIVLSERLKDEMRAMYRDDVAELSALLGRDLSHWLEK